MTTQLNVAEVFSRLWDARYISVEPSGRAYEKQVMKLIGRRFLWQKKPLVASLL